MLLYSTLLCKKIARAPGGQKKFRLTKRGGGGNRIDPNNEYIMNIRLVLINSINSNDDLVIHLLSRFFFSCIYLQCSSLLLAELIFCSQVCKYPSLNYSFCSDISQV